MDRLQKLFSSILSPRLLPRRSPVIVTFLLLFLFLVFQRCTCSCRLNNAQVINEIGGIDHPTYGFARVPME